MTGPLAYLITFRCYGTWLHGDERGSVDRNNRARGQALLTSNLARQKFERARMKHSAIELNSRQRFIVKQTIEAVCEFKRWHLSAKAVRTNHVHIVVSTDCPPEKAMETFKARATRRMAELGVLSPGTKPWARHGSTRYLWTAEAVVAACHYVNEGQGAELPLQEFE